MADAPKYKLKVVTERDPLNIRPAAALIEPILGTIAIGTVVEAYECKSVGDYTWYRIGEGRWIAGSDTKGKVFAKVIETHTSAQQDPANTNNQQSSTQPQQQMELSDGNRTIPGGGIDQSLINSLLAQEQTLLNRNRVEGSVRLFGIPHQFTQSTDIRVNQSLDMGRKYLETVISEAPILTIIPGKPNYLPDVDGKEKSALTEMFNQLSKGEGESSLINDILGDGDKEVRYFNFIWDYYMYMRYVNVLCSATSILLGLTDEHGFLNGDKVIPYRRFDWKNYKFSNVYKQYPTEQRTGAFVRDQNMDTSGMSEVERNIAEQRQGQREDESVFNEFFDQLTGASSDYVQFYFDPSTSFNESMSNSTNQSKIAGVIDTAEGLIKEWGFLANASTHGNFGPESLTGLSEKLKESLGGGNDGMLTRLMSMGTVVLSGANLVFPEIWSDASYSKGYSITIDLTSPYGTKEAIYLNIFVPLMHLIALVMPRQFSPNSFKSPFLVKAFARGMFNCEMGIVDSLTIEKGGSGDSWSVDGLPTEVRVTVSIRDLYANMTMTSEREVRMFFQNQSLMEFLASSCGIDLVKPELKLKADLMRSLAFGYFTEMPRTLYESVAGSIRTNLFGWWSDLTKFTKMR